MDDAAFEADRRRLFGIAYRMTGAVADAEDIVQEAWLRWQSVDHDEIERPEAWLTTVTSRLALDWLRSAQKRRETYVGPWLPEPVLTSTDPTDPAEVVELGDTVTLGFFAVLEQLTPVDRAVFLLRDVFDVPYSEIAGVVDRSEATCRQIAKRARDRVRAERPPVDLPAERQRALLDAFLGALASGEIEQLEALLAEDVMLVSDGGVAARAARRPVVTPRRVGRLVHNLYRRAADVTDIAIVEANGRPAVYASWSGTPVLMLTLDADDQGRIHRLWVMRNPAKLARVAAELASRPE